MGARGATKMKFLIGDVVAIKSGICVFSSKLLTGTVINEVQGMYYVVSNEGQARFYRPEELMYYKQGKLLSTESTDLSTI